MSDAPNAAPAPAAAHQQAPESTNESVSNDTNKKVVSNDTKTEEQKAREKLLRKYKLKVDGEEFETEVDLNDEDSVKKHLQMSHAAQKRISQAAEEKRKAIQLLKQFDENPDVLLRRLGPRGREIAEQYLLEQIQDQMLSAEEKELRDLRKFKEQKEKERLEAEESSKKQAEKEQTDRYRQHYEKIFIDALGKTKLPRNDRIVREMAELQYKSLELGIELTADDLAQELEKREMDKLKALLSTAEGEQLLALLGDDVANKIRKSDIARIKAKQNDLFKPREQKAESLVPKAGKHYMTTEEWKEQVAKKLGQSST